ncbi:MAG: hypothetical protein ACJ786_21125, partial [Catenulispora sp.]
MSAKSEELEGLREGEPGGPGGVAESEVAQDVAEETARAVAEASGEDVRPGAGSGDRGAAGTTPAAAAGAVDPLATTVVIDADAKPVPARRERHTPLY